MTQFNQHIALSVLQKTFFKHHDNMYPEDYCVHYYALPVMMPSGAVEYVAVNKYRSNYTTSRRKECNAFLRQARSWALLNQSPYFPMAWDWMNLHQRRVVACFAGQGLPEEISLICGLAVACGFKSPYEIQGWASENFGMDCVGLVSSYLVSLGTFTDMVRYIPKYRQIAGAATRIDDIKYDNAILWADWTGTSAKVRPNPGNKSHIAIIERWASFGSSFYVTQSAGSKGGVDYGRLYTIEKVPKTSNGNKAMWKIKPSGQRAFWAVITKTMPYHTPPSED